MEGAGARFVSPTGYVDLDNDCYSIDLKSTRSREEVNPKEDLAFYFKTYLAPKYGLDNINVSNVASFMKELEMNWSKLTPELKSNVLDIMVDNILSENYDFKNSLMAKLNINLPPATAPTTPSFSKSSFGKSNFGSPQTAMYIVMGVIFLLLIIYLANQINVKQPGFSKMF
jgi:hypothetical protein